MNETKRKREYVVRFLVLIVMVSLVAALGAGMLEDYFDDVIDQTFVLQLFCPICSIVYFYVRKYFDEEYQLKGKKTTQPKLFAITLATILVAMVSAIVIVYAAAIFAQLTGKDLFFWDFTTCWIYMMIIIAPVLITLLCVDGIFVSLSGLINKMDRNISGAWMLLLANILLLGVGLLFKEDFFRGIHGGSSTTLIFSIFLSLKIGRWIMVWLIIGTVVYSLLHRILRKIKISPAFILLVTICILAVGERIFLVYQRTHNISLSWMKIMEETTSEGDFLWWWNNSIKPVKTVSPILIMLILSDIIYLLLRWYEDRKRSISKVELPEELEEIKE